MPCFLLHGLAGVNWAQNLSKINLYSMIPADYGLRQRGPFPGPDPKMAEAKAELVKLDAELAAITAAGTEP